MSLYSEHLKTVIRRFDEALEATGFDSALIFSGQPQVAFLDDNSYPYRVNPLFKYWLPITENPKSYIFYRKGETPKLFLFQARDFWHTQPQLPPGEWQELFDIQLIDTIQPVRSALTGQLSKAAFLGEAFEGLEAWGLAEVNPSELINYLHFQRTLKTDYEVNCLRKANVLAAQGHIAAKQAFDNKASELEIHHAYLAAIECHEPQLPYNSIVALNQNGAVLHYDMYETKAPAEHLSFLIDAGALHDGYCADITRTYSASTEGFYAELVQAMDEAEQAIIGEVAVGRSYYDLHVEMHRKIAGLLAQFGFFKIPAEAIFERGYTRAFFPHGLGHFIGLQVHDVAGHLKSPQGESYAPDAHHPFLRLRQTIQAGQVFTIEPGLYVVDQLLEEFEGNEDFNWQRIAELRPYGGVRIEDSVYVREDGTVENLTRDAFASLK